MNQSPRDAAASASSAALQAPVSDSVPKTSRKRSVEDARKARLERKKRYRQSEEGKAQIKAYRQSFAGKAKAAKARQSVAGKARAAKANAKHSASDKGKEKRKAYRQSAVGKASASQRRQTARLREKEQRN